MISDRQVNNKKANVFDLKQRKIVSKKWGEIKMGDILEIKKDHDLPSDIMLLYAENEAQEPVDIVFVDTMNLDGETNLKP